MEKRFRSRPWKRSEEAPIRFEHSEKVLILLIFVGNVLLIFLTSANVFY